MSVTPRRGALVMVYGIPGSGKSTFALWWTYRMGVPALYFSADMDAFDAITRTGALATGHEVSFVANAISSGGMGYIEDEVSDIPIQWCFDSGPTLMDVAAELDAYIELWDRYPSVIVIDNLLNIEGETEEEQAGLKFIMKELHRLAHETGCAVIVLHHAREEGSPSRPAPRSAIQGKVSQLPELILSVALDQDDGSYMVAPVKNRSGKQDPTGATFIRLQADPERASFAPYIPRITYGGWSG